ncbi:MAG: hypothetical protein GWN01_01455 [Nitrosopumilaceae archaeon]|nr:hypothetical protein [Nitrosopumilaceae archaeon]NIU86025.1 hypothetical protein [Nitrosopumilaceae archaeon]NIX60244.1 hypothetical protein [Nitrosopumilaceae archaeon]
MNKVAKGRNAEVRALNSSLAINIHEDEKNNFEFYLYDRRSHGILQWYRMMPKRIEQAVDLSGKK